MGRKQVGGRQNKLIASYFIHYQLVPSKLNKSPGKLTLLFFLALLIWNGEKKIDFFNGQKPKPKRNLAGINQTQQQNEKKKYWFSVAWVNQLKKTKLNLDKENRKKQFRNKKGRRGRERMFMLGGWSVVGVAGNNPSPVMKSFILQSNQLQSYFFAWGLWKRQYCCNKGIYHHHKNVISVTNQVIREISF